MPIKFTLKVLLAMNDMTQKQLAEVTGIRPPTISAICNNSIKEMPIGVLDKLCTTLHCQPGDLMVYVHDESENPFYSETGLRKEQRNE